MTRCDIDKSALTTEEWLKTFYSGECAKLFKQAGYTVPHTSQVDIHYSLPSKGAARGSRSQRIGEAWVPECNSEGRHTILISPAIEPEEPSRSLEILGTLIHEVVHIVVGVQHGHRAPFKKCALAVGLTGKMTATTNGPELTERLTEWLKLNGLCPAGALNVSNRKKQSTRMIKAQCIPCNYIVRLSRSQAEKGLPLCGCCGERMTV